VPAAELGRHEPRPERRLYRREPLLQLAALEEGAGDLRQVGQRARPGDRVLETESIEGGDLDQAADLRQRGQTLEVEGEGSSSGD
jgi:hypothetical protein